MSADYINSELQARLFACERLVEQLLRREQDIKDRLDRAVQLLQQLTRRTT